MYPYTDTDPQAYAAINFLGSERLTVHRSSEDETKVRFTWSEAGLLNTPRHDVDFKTAKEFLTDALSVVEALEEKAPKPRYVVSVTDGDGDVWYQKDDGRLVLKPHFDSGFAEGVTLAYLKATYGVRDVDVVEVPAV